MIELWYGLVGGLADILRFFHDAVEPVVGPYAWGWGIILLTLAVRLVLLPLTIKQTSSMRGMQALQPEMTRIREKYKADRSLMRTDPEKYRALQTKQQEELSKLMREHNVNPAGGCLPLLAQMPILFALYQVFINTTYVPELLQAPFYLVPRLEQTASQGGIGPYLLLALMGATTFVSTRQTARMNQNPQMAQQQQILQYVMPALLVVFGFNLPLALLLHGVTTNLWPMGQQPVRPRAIPPVLPAGGAPAPPAAGPRGGPGGGSGGGAGGGGGRRGLFGMGRPAAAAGGQGGATAAADATAAPKKGETAAKGAPTPKRSEARQQHKGASRDANTPKRGNGRTPAKGKGGRPGSPAKPKR